MRYKIEFSYDGTGFFGYQRQSGELRTVQGELEKSLSTLFDESVEVHASGRTDIGVHARGQVAHFDLEKVIKPEKILYALNRFLARDIRIHTCQSVDKSFHARKSAIGKYYTYRLYLGKSPCAIGYNMYNHVSVDFDRESFKECLSLVVGTHDFQGFCGRGSSVKNFERTIYKIAFEEEQDWLLIHFIGNGFLRKMIRNLVGTALDIAIGRKPKVAMQETLLEKNRTKGGRTAQAEGLVLECVYYDKVSLKKRIESLV